MAPLTPESMLWAHQLKREHGHLLKRIDQLESGSSKTEDRIKAVENAAKSNSSGDAASLATLAKQIQAIDSSGIHERIGGVEKDVNRKLDDVEAQNEAMTMQIASLEQGKQKAESDRKATLTKDKALLKRIGEVEEGLKQYAEKLDLIGKTINGTRLGQIMEQLEGLTKQVMREGEKMKLLTESVEALETANQELIKANQKLEARLAEMSDRVDAKEDRRREEDAEVGAEEEEVLTSPESRKKKSHKWGGGGADKDIIAQGATIFGVKTKPSAPKVKPAASQKAAPRPQPQKKMPVPKKKISVPKVAGPGSDRKSHKWGGGGADKDIIQAGLSQETKRGRPSVGTKEASPLSKAKKWAGGKEVVRAGKGWYEIEDSPPESEEEEPKPKARAPREPAKPKDPRGRPKKVVPVDENGTPIKRPRGRPRKYPRPDDLQSQNTPTESARSSLAPQQGAVETKKRKAEPLEESFDDSLRPPPKKSKSSPGPSDHEMFDYSVPSSPPHRQRNDTQDSFKIPNSEPDLEKQPRRQTLQLNDDLSSPFGQMSR